MADDKTLICLVCPKGCQLKVTGDLKVTGHGCLRGIAFAHEELTNPLRYLTTTVKVLSPNLSRLPVITSNKIPKKDLYRLSLYLVKHTVTPPINLGEVIIDEPLGIPVKIIATRTILK